VRLWEVATGRFLFGLKGHNGPVEESVFSEDGNTVYTLGRDGTVRAWTISTEHTGPVNQVLFSETGSLATAGNDGTVKLWDPFGGDVLQILTGHQQAVEAVAFTSDGMSLATASRDHSVKIWDTVTGKKTATLQGHVDAVNDVAFDPTDKSVLATAGLDGRVLLWEGTKEVELGKHEWQASHLAFSPDGSRIASGGSNGDAFIWGVKAKGKIATLHDPNFGGILKAHGMAIWRIAFSPKGDFVLTCSEDKTAKIWRASDGHLVCSFNEHAGIVTDGQFNPQDGRTVVTASLDNTAKIWEVSSGKLLQNLTGHTQPVIAAIFDHTGTLIATASWDGTTRIWQKNQGEGLFKEVLTLTSSGQVSSVDFSPDGKRIAIGSSTGEVTIFPFDREALMNLANRRFTRP
jgi:WD40 repeat protein